ncbi:hypothetical protein, partial [Acinetobacter sp.]|uniref:hypothetical protein n=1 Tax=Acinetobacter sp. TaxID=472 RepID=UPI00257B4F92
LSLISGVYFNFVIGIVSQNIDSPTNTVRFIKSLKKQIKARLKKIAKHEGKLAKLKKKLKNQK